MSLGAFDSAPSQRQKEGNVYICLEVVIFSSADSEPLDPDRRKNTQQPTKHEQQEARKAEIIARTQQGETAEQIAAAFAAQGEL